MTQHVTKFKIATVAFPENFPAFSKFLKAAKAKKTKSKNKLQIYSPPPTVIDSQ